MQTPSAPASPGDQQPGRHDRAFTAARRTLISAALLCALGGVVAVAVVVVMGLSHQQVPSGWVQPFLTLLPLAFVLLGGVIILGIVQRRLN